MSETDWVPSRIFSGSRLQRQVYHRSVLPNRLRIVTSPKREAESVAIGFWMRVGARYESERMSGISHFLEHLLFKGTKHRSSKRIKEEIEGAGGVLNAFTDEEFTCLWAKVQPKDFKGAFDVLTDMVLHPSCEVKEIDKERQVILEEIRMYRDLPMQSVHDLLNAILWPNHPLGRDVAGSERSLKGIGRRDLISFQRRYYTPTNTVIAVCGRVTHREVMEAALPLWRHLAGGQAARCRRAAARQRRPRLKFELKETEQTHLSLGFHAFPRNHPQVHALSLLNVVLGGNMSSRLFHEVREVRGLAYEIGSQIKRFQDTGLFSVSAGVEHRHLAACLQVVLRELRRLRREGITLKEFEQAKEYLTGQVLFSLEDTVEHMTWVGECEMLLGAVEPVEEILEQVGRLKKSDVVQAARALLRPYRANLAIIGPVSTQVRRRIGRMLEG